MTSTREQNAAERAEREREAERIADQDALARKLRHIEATIIADWSDVLADQDGEPLLVVRWEDGHELTAWEAARSTEDRFLLAFTLRNRLQQVVTTGTSYGYAEALADKLHELQGEVRLEFVSCTCDGTGIVFTFPVEDAGIQHPYGDDVAACTHCDRFASDQDAARSYGQLNGPWAADDEDGFPRQGGYMVTATLPEGQKTIIVRGDYPEACIDAQAAGEPPYLVERVYRVEPDVYRVAKTVNDGAARGWTAPHEAMLDLGDAVRILLDSPTADRISLGQTILDAAEYMQAQVIELQVPGLRDPALLQRARSEESDLLAAGLFIALVEVADRYVQQAEGMTIEGALLGLRENLESLVEARA